MTDNVTVLMPFGGAKSENRQHLLIMTVVTLVAEYMNAELFVKGDSVYWKTCAKFVSI